MVSPTRSIEILVCSSSSSWSIVEAEVTNTQVSSAAGANIPDNFAVELETRPEDDGLSLAASRSECVVAWDVAATQAERLRNYDLLQVALEQLPQGQGPGPGHDLDQDQSDRGLDCGGLLAPCSGQEAWLDSLLEVIDLGAFRAFLQGLKGRDGIDVPEVKYASDCSGVDSPAVAFKSLLTRLKD